MLREHEMQFIFVLLFWFWAWKNFMLLIETLSIVDIILNNVK